MNQPARLNKSRYRDHMSNLESISWSHYLVYVLWCPLEKRIKYVGYTAGYPWSRLAAHMADAATAAKAPASARRHPKDEWLMRLQAAGLLPIMRVMKGFEDKRSAYQYEAQLIALIGSRRTLTNRYPGNPNWRPSPGWHFGGGKEKVYVPGPKEVLTNHPYAAWFPANL